MGKIVMPGDCHLLLPDSAPVGEWLHARTQGMGGSEVAALFGHSPYATAWDIWKLKVNEDGKPRFLDPPPAKVQRVRPELLTDDPVFEFGHRLEAMIALKTCDELGLVPRSAGGLWQHNQHPLMIVTPDAIGTRARSWKPECLIECKSAADSEHWDEGVAPLQYQVQATIQMGITGIHTCYLGCFVLGFARDFYIVKIDYDHDWFMEMVAEVEKFWTNHVLTGEPPMLDYEHSHTEDLLRDMHPRVLRESVDLPNGAAEWVAAYFKAKEVVKEAEKQVDAAKNWLKAQLGGAAAGYLAGQKLVSWPEIVSHRVSVSKIRELYPEIIDDVTEESSYRRLTVRKPKA